MPEFNDLKIASVTRQTSESVAISFDLPEALRAEYRFRPGQYLTLRAEVDGQDIRRSYSIASMGDAPLTVGVKQVEGGAFSTFAQGLKPGDMLSVMVPQGRFTPNDEASLLLVAAGSGITPMMSIAADALARNARVTLVYGNRQTSSIMFRAELDALKDRYLGQFTLIHILSREEQDVPLLNGRVTGEKIAALVKAGAIDLGCDGTFLCGPGEMIDNVAETLASLDMPRERVHFERFYTEDDAPRAPRSKAAETAAASGVSVSVVLDGTRRDFTVEARDDTVLDAAHRQGLELPFSCKGGMCCTCRCKVAEGSAEMAVNYSLEQWELDQGFILACQTRPTSEKLVLDFDAA